MVILKAEKWVHGGFCLAYKNGKTYFIKGALPQEEVECEILKETSKVVHARVTKVLSFSQERIQSDCKIFPLCGGCSFRHIPYEKELEIKKNLLQEEWKRKQIFFAKDISVVYSNPNFYRNNFQIKFQNGKFGFFQEFSNKILEIPKEGCQNLSIGLNKFLNTEKLNYSLKWRELTKIYPYDRETGEYHFENLKILVPKNGFFQVNSFLLPVWLKEIQTLVPKGLKVLELFSGCGLISLVVSELCENLLGIELDSTSVRYAKRNAKLNKKFNLKFQELNLYKMKLFNYECELLLCNPPRSGLGKKVLDWIRRNSPSYILYLSCNYLTLSFDLKEILQYEYEIQHVKIFDFFPRTPYFETLVFLKKTCEI